MRGGSGPSLREEGLLYCSTVEKAPPRLVDVRELFFGELARRGLRQVWYCRASAPGSGGIESMTEAVRVAFPPRLRGNSSLVRGINTLLYLGGDVFFMLRASCQNASLYLIRDKYLATIPAWVLARLLGRRFVVWSSYPFPEHDREMARIAAWPKAFLLRSRAALGELLFYRWAMRRADHVFVQSDFMLRELTGKGVPAEKMTAVPMGIAAPAFREAQASCPVEVVPGRVLYLGTLARIRRLGMIIRAFSAVAQRVPHATLMLVGEGVDPADRKELEAEVERLSLGDRVVFTGFLPIGEAWDRVRSAEICLSPIIPSPALRCASPTKLVEYLAFGKPVVANDHPEQAEIIRQSGAGLCVSWDEAAFADAIAHLLLDPDRARALGARGPEWVRAHRLYDRIGDCVFHELRKTLASRCSA